MPALSGGPPAAPVAFRYKLDPATGQYAHASAIMILTPEGKLSRYFYGVEYAPRDVRLGLVEASQNKIGSPVDQILLFCYHYDPATGKYGAIAMNMVRFAGATFVLICGTFLFVAWRRDWRRDRDRKSTRLNSSHLGISYAVFCLKKKTNPHRTAHLTTTHATNRPSDTPTGHL